MTNFRLIDGEVGRIEYLRNCISPRVLEKFKIFMNYFDAGKFVANPSLNIENLTPEQRHFLAGYGLRYYNVMDYEAVPGTQTKFLILGFTPESILSQTELAMNKAEDFFEPLDTSNMFREFDRDQIIGHLRDQKALPENFVEERTPMILNSAESPLIIACFPLSFGA